MSRLFFMATVLCFLSACASRGLTLSQQMPGYDKDLNPVSLEQGYTVDDRGDIHARVLTAETEMDARYLASSNFAYATLDPKFGAFVFGKSNTVKKPAALRPREEAPVSEPRLH